MSKKTAVWCTVVVATAVVLAPMIATAGQRPSEEKQGAGSVTIDIAYGWTTTWGNNVHVGDRVSVRPFTHLFDEGSSLDPVSTPMDSSWMPLVRVGYRGDEWGVSGNLWRVTTDGSTDGSFVTREERPEIVRMWSEWRGDFGRETTYMARNDLSLTSGRIDLTHGLTSDVVLSLGLQIATFENERVESNNVTEPGVHDEMTGRSRLTGWLVGPAFGLQGAASPSASTTLRVSFSQAFLFAKLNNEANWDWEQSFRWDPYGADVHVDTTLPSDVAVPVTEAHASFQVALGEHISIGVIFFLSAWYDMPTAREFSYPLERWEERNRTLVFATVGPVVSLRF